MLGDRIITATLIGETVEGSVAECCLQRGILLPLLFRMVVDKLTEGLAKGCYTQWYVLSSSVENSQILSDSFFRRLWVWNSIRVVKLSYQSIHKRYSTWINIL
jgi:hypothetical protein